MPTLNTYFAPLSFVQSLLGMGDKSTCQKMDLKKINEEEMRKNEVMGLKKYSWQGPFFFFFFFQKNLNFFF